MPDHGCYQTRKCWIREVQPIALTTMNESLGCQPHQAEIFLPLSSGKSVTWPLLVSDSKSWCIGRLLQSSGTHHIHKNGRTLPVSQKGHQTVTLIVNGSLLFDQCCTDWHVIFLRSQRDHDSNGTLKSSLCIDVAFENQSHFLTQTLTGMAMDCSITKFKAQLLAALNMSWLRSRHVFEPMSASALLWQLGILFCCVCRLWGPELLEPCARILRRAWKCCKLAGSLWNTWATARLCLPLTCLCQCKVTELMGCDRHGLSADKRCALNSCYVTVALLGKTASSRFNSSCGALPSFSSDTMILSCLGLLVYPYIAAKVYVLLLHR